MDVIDSDTLKSHRTHFQPFDSQYRDTTVAIDAEMLLSIWTSLENGF